MDSVRIRPFIESLGEFFVKMLGAEVRRDSAVRENADRGFSEDLVASIDLSGWARGRVEIAFPERTAVAIVNSLTGSSFDRVDGSVLDGLAETVNIVAGHAKTIMTCDGSPPLILGLPSVAHGNRNSPMPEPEGEWVEVSFSSDLGPLAMRVTFDTCE